MKRASLLSLFLCLFLAACNQSDKGTTLVTGNIFKPVLFQINDQDADKKIIDLGEHVLTDDPRELTVKIYNDSGFPYTNFSFIFTAANNDMPSINFIPDELGEIKFPGLGGTCTQSLAPKATCTVKLMFAPRNERYYTEFIELKFKNFVDEETHSTTVTSLVGMPASLVFTNDQTQYVFGDLIGTQHIPVVERADAITYTQVMEVINAGGLSARNMNVNLLQTCVSTETNLCPTGMGNVYSYSSDCPTKLMPGEKCNITINYAPKNQDPDSGPVPEDIKEINYRSTFTLSYEKDPHGGTAGLNAYYRSLSTNIEAKFKVSITTLVFETPIIVGNRDVRTFRTNNLGFREGEIKALAMRDSGGTLVATCGPKDNTLLLECRDQSNAVLTLEQFPYTIKDRNDCLRSAADGAYYVPVGSGCVFDLIFQPSVNYLVDKPTEFKDWQPEIIYDARWKGLEKIVTKKLFKVSAESKAAARIILQRIAYESLNVTTFPGNSPWVTDMGRLALQSPTYFKRKPLAITFKNVGSIPAVNITLKDGRGTNIPIGGAGADIGIWGGVNKYYYKPVTASSSSCTQIDPGASCTITSNFAPIGLLDDQQQFENMFDYIDPDSYTDLLKRPNNYKAFILNYDSGATFTDLNREDPQDYPRLSSEARLKALLVQKGMLMQLGDDTIRNKNSFGGGVNVSGDTWVGTFYVTNMGTGLVPYMRILNVPSQTSLPVSTRNYSLKILPTPDFAAKGADYDCTTLFDLDYTKTVPITAMPETRTGLFGGLPKDESCVFSVEYKMYDSWLRANSKSCDDATPPQTNEELMRLFSRDYEAANSGMGLWEYCSNEAALIQGWMGILIRFFDGDFSDPSALSSNYGNRFDLQGWDLSGMQSWTSKFAPVSFGPWLQSTMYRPGFSLPAIPAQSKPATIIPDTWFYGTPISPFMLENDPLQTNVFIQAGVARNVLPTLPSWASRTSYDYIIYIGTYPQGADPVVFPLSIRNNGGGFPKVYNFTPSAATPPSDASFSLQSTNIFPQFVGGGSDIMSTTALTPITFGFNPSTAGEHSMPINFDYERSTHTGTLYYDKSSTPSPSVPKNSTHAKYLVVANVLATGTFPKLTLDMQDYDVVQNPGLPPTVTPTTITSVPLTWNYTPPTGSIIFDTIKLTSLPTANDVYAKKTLTFKNQTAFPLNDFKVLYRPDAILNVPKIVPSSLAVVTAESTCTSGQTIPAGGNCTLTFKYQPVSGDTADLTVLTAIYKIAPNQYTMQNLTLSLLPRSPGLVKEAIRTTVAINVKPIAGNPSQIVRDSYEMTFGTANLNVVPKTFAWDQTLNGTYQWMKFVNTQTTKASFLLSYHKYLAQHSLRGYTPIILPATSVVPAAGEYRIVGGYEFAPIFMRKYSDGTVRILVEATKGCLFGDDELNGAVLPHQKGFSSATTALNPCYFITTFNANFEYLQDDIKVNDGDDMRNAAMELWYYSVNRSSTASLWTHIKGTINPDTSTLAGTYTNVTAFDNRTVSFEVPKFTASNPLLGPVVGTRVILATSASALNDPYNPSLTSYVDIKPYNAVLPQTANFTTGMSNGNYYYFRAVAIRRDVRFNFNTCPAPATCRFPGLPAGEYLSAGANTQAKVLVPPNNHAYFYNANIIVEKTLQGGVAYDPYITGSNKCTTKTQVIIRDPGIIQKPYTLISRAAWNLLLANPTATSYSNMDQVSHWLSDAPANIDVKCGAFPSFVPNSSSQLMDDVKTFYLRSSANPNANVNQAVGGIPGTASSNYNSYIDGTVGYASSRCMAILGAPIP